MKKKSFLIQQNIYVLSINWHLTNLCRSVRSTMYLDIRRLKHNMSCFVDETSLITLVFSFIFSTFDYCNALFKKTKSMSN